MFLLFASWLGTTINPWLKLPMSQQFSLVPKMYESLKFYCIVEPPLKVISD